MRLKLFLAPGLTSAVTILYTNKGHKTWRRIEVVVTSLTRNQVVRKGTWVRIPPSPPRRRGRHIVRGGFFCKSHLSLILSRLLSKSNPLRWASIRFSYPEFGYLFCQRFPRCRGLRIVRGGAKADSFPFYYQLKVFFYKRKPPSTAMV